MPLFKEPVTHLECQFFKQNQKIDEKEDKKTDLENHKDIFIMK